MIESLDASLYAFVFMNIQQKELFDRLKRKIQRKLDEFQTLSQENIQLRHKVELLDQKLEESLRREFSLREENKRLKVVQAMVGDTEQKKLMKLKMNKLIKEIDYCIESLKRQ
ncbi:MAG: hypothetical protein C4K58_07730 [Flavobacteriaceae bacterium]|nr:MAG: hypothetical protein C4K58_07730 [Flavobacteriaceae bacterium]